MPLTKSSSKAAFRANVSEMVRADHPQKQALAAAYRNQREARAKGYQEGGSVPLTERFQETPRRPPAYSGEITDTWSEVVPFRGGLADTYAMSPRDLREHLAERGKEPPRTSFSPAPRSRTHMGPRADGGGIDYQKDQSRYSDGDAYRRMPLSENVDDLRNEDRAKYMERDQAQRAREVAALRTGGLRRQVNRPMAPISRASGGRVQVKNMLDEAAGKLEDGLTSVGKAGGGGLGFLSQFFGQGGGGGLSGSFSPQAWQQSLQQTGDPWRSAFQSFTGRGQPQPAAPQAPAPAQGMRLGYAEGGELPYRGGEITPWYVRSEAQQMRRAASGPIQSIVPGRTDALSMSVKRGSYVVPADVVSGMPGAQGNSAAGHKILENMFTKGPYGMNLPRGGGSRGAFPRLPATPRAEGGLVGNPEGGEDDLVDIDAAGGEHILDPEVAQALGNGDPELGFKILDNFVKKIRDMHINTLKKLPGPKQS